MNVPRKAPMKVLVRRVTFWYGLVGSSRLGTSESRLRRKRVLVGHTAGQWVICKKMFLGYLFLIHFQRNRAHQLDHPKEEERCPYEGMVVDVYGYCR